MDSVQVDGVTYVRVKTPAPPPDDGALPVESEVEASSDQREAES